MTLATPLTQGRKNPEVWLWTVKQCPFCGQEHTHGGGKYEGDPRDLLSGRSPHCDPTVKGRPSQYTLVDADPARTEKMIAARKA